MGGVRFEGDAGTLDYELDKHLVSKTTGQMPAKFDYTFMPENGRTKIETKAEYEIPQSLLGRLAEPCVRKLNEREADVFLANLNGRLEVVDALRILLPKGPPGPLLVCAEKLRFPTVANV